jgi:hypothetical protein
VYKVSASLLLISGSIALGYEPGHFIAYSFVPKTFRNAVAIGGGSVLAHFPLSLDIQDRNFHSNDGLDLTDDERFRRIGHLPWFRSLNFLRGG